MEKDLEGVLKRLGFKEVQESGLMTIHFTWRKEHSSEEKETKESFDNWQDVTDYIEVNEGVGVRLVRG